MSHVAASVIGFVVAIAFCYLLQDGIHIPSRADFYTLVKTCEAPAMRVSKRNSDGQLFVVFLNGDFLPFDKDARVEEVCP